MGWEDSMSAVFDDLEQQAAGLHLVERDAEVAGLSAAEYSRVSLAARLHASVGRDLRLRLVGGQQLSGRLARTGEDWLLLVDRSAEWIVRHDGLCSVQGISGRADPVETWSVLDRLTLRAVLRRLSGEGEPCLVHFVDDQRVHGRVGRVGQDFFELKTGVEPDSAVHVVTFAAVSALQGVTQ